MWPRVFAHIRDIADGDGDLTHWLRQHTAFLKSKN
jgi:hypothetical protein